MTEHSHLGASGAERWMHCPGSVALVQRFGKPDEQGDGPDYRWQGTVAHAAIADCLTTGLDAWEVVGREYEGHVLTADLAEGVAFYLSVVTPLLAGATGNVYVEEHLSAPDIHPALFGTVDLGFVMGSTLRIFDYKNGAGVSVDVEENPQEMYYAFLLLVKLERYHPETFKDRVKGVELTIVQPNDFNPAGKVRTWLTTPEHILDWGYNTLVKAMCEADKGQPQLDVGSHCRFCPAKIICPAQQLLFAQLASANAADAKQMTDDELGRYYELMEPAAMFIKAVKEETYSRLMNGAELASAKLVRSQADRVWKDGALARFSTLYGTAAFTDPKLKSPAQMEDLPQAKPLVREFAFTPDTGLTVKPIGAKGLAIKPPKKTSLLSNVEGT
jgi:hypothetical protein